MKKRLIYSLVSTIILYLIVAFIQWDILFIRILPELSQLDRFMYILALIGKEAIVQIFYIEFEK